MTSIYFNHILRSAKENMFIECLKVECVAYDCEDADPVADRILFNMINWITETR